jgi:rhomboid protease GluP
MQPDPSTSVVSGSSPQVQHKLAPARITPILIGLNALVFLAMVVTGVSITEPTSLQLVQWGANFGPLTVSGQWWRLLTACFLHVGIIHIAINMFILYQAGMFTERLFGPVRYLAVYLIAGIGGNILGILLHPNIVSAGASGAIFGVYGGLLAFLLRNRAVVRPEAAKAIARSALIFLGYNLVYGLATPHTDLTAHIGGLFTGFVAGYALARPRPLLAPPAISDQLASSETDLR